MIKLPKDILFVNIVTIISLICIFTFPLYKYPLNIISYIPLAFILPGYVAILSMYPAKFKRLSYKHILGSIIFSVFLATLFVLMIKYSFLSMKLTNSFLIIGILTVILSLDVTEGMMRTNNTKKYIVKPEQGIKVYNFHYSIKDLYLIIFLTLIALIILVTPTLYINGHILYPMKTIFGYLLILLLGYAIWTASVPKRQPSKIKPLVFSFIFSIIIFAISFIVLKFSLSVGPSKILAYIMSIFIGLFCIVACLRRVNIPKIEKLSIEKKHEPNKPDVITYEKLDSLMEDKNNPNSIKVNNKGSESLISILGPKLTIETKPQETKPQETKPQETKPQETKPQETKPQETKPQETKPQETKPQETKPQETKPQETKPHKNKPRFGSYDLLLISLTTILCIIFVILPNLKHSMITSILLLILILFIPGYALISALYPKKGFLHGIERLILSFGFTLMGLAFSLVINDAFRYINISLTLITLFISAFTFIMVIISLIRRRRVPDDEQFYVNFWGKTKSSKVISVILLILILAGSSSAVYIDYTYQGSTEFYILGPGGSATDYPTNLTVGQQGSVIIEIINNEGKSADYNIVVASNGTKISELNVTVSNGAQTEIPYNFTASTAGQKNIEFMLYKLPNTTDVYRSVVMPVSIT